MKKALSMILVFVMLLSLCACGKKDTGVTEPTTTPTQTATENTQEATISATDATQTPTQEMTEEPTEEPSVAPTEEPVNTSKTTAAPTTKATAAPTTKATAAPATKATVAATTAPATKPATAPATVATTCSHSYKEASCTAPKTCTKCGATEGAAAGHSWKAATCAAPKTCAKCGATEGSVVAHNYVNSVCSMCGDTQVVNIPFDGGKWCLDALSGTQLNRMRITASEGTGNLSVSFWGEQQVMAGAPFNFNGKNYYDQGFGKGAELTYTESGDTVVVTSSAYDGLVTGKLTLKRTAYNQYTITAVTDTIISGSITSALAVGNVFVGTANN